MKDLTSFIQEHRIEIGKGKEKDFDVTPPIYYQSLQNAFQHYFATFQSIKNSSHLHFVNPRAFNDKMGQVGGKNKDNITYCILDFHRFFDLFFKRILIEYFGSKQNQLSAFRKTMSQLFHYNGEELEKTKYSFLTSEINKETFDQLNSIRNDIFHEGNKLIDLHALDFLVAHRIAPIIQKILHAEANLLSEPQLYFLKTPLGLNVLDQMLNNNFHYTPEEFTTPDEPLTAKLIYFNHLKEFGRAANVIHPALRMNINFFEPADERPLERLKSHALAEKNHDHFYHLKTCPCCGYETLVVYRKSVPWPFNEKLDYLEIKWCRCFVCDYSLRDNLPEPKEFSLTDIAIFD